MAYSIVWSEQALDDVDHIAEYICRDSEFYAQKVASEIYAKGDSLQENPSRGRKVPELANPNIRELFISSYRLIYEIQNHEVEILAVVHGKRLLVSIKEGK